MRVRLHPLSTFSIAGRCERTGQLGVAVSTADVGAGRLVTWARTAAGAVAAQSWPSLYGAIAALNRLEGGADAKTALAEAMANDPGRALRQMGIVDSNGNAAAWTGGDCSSWAGHLTGDGFSAQGNMLVGRQTVDELVRAFCERPEDDLAERLLCALEAGQAAGGDKRGRQSSALYVVARDPYPLWDIRVDEHPQPVAELRRIVTIAEHQLLPFVEGLPTPKQPQGSLSDEFVRMNLLPPPDRPGGGGSSPDPRSLHP